MLLDVSYTDGLLLAVFLWHIRLTPCIRHVVRLTKVDFWIRLNWLSRTSFWRTSRSRIDLVFVGDSLVIPSDCPLGDWMRTRSV